MLRLAAAQRADGVAIVRPGSEAVVSISAGGGATVGLPGDWHVSVAAAVAAAAAGYAR